MSEYWKSTPKYWCKHCKTYVRDTKLEKQNHDATPKHQGNIKRFLRDLHRGNERDEREKQRAKDEVARLNGAPLAPPPTPSESKNNASSRRSAAISTRSDSVMQQATPAERRQQMAKLAEMGIEVPEEYRRDMAMAGSWQVLSERPLFDDIKKEDEGEGRGDRDKGDEVEDAKPRSRKMRRLDGQEMGEEILETSRRQPWGTAILKYPGAGGDEDDLDALLGSTSNILPKKENVQKLKTEETAASNITQTFSVAAEVPEVKIPSIKKEDSTETDGGGVVLGGVNGMPTKSEDNFAPNSVTFKKRKSKPVDRR